MAAKLKQQAAALELSLLDTPPTQDQDDDRSAIFFIEACLCNVFLYNCKAREF